MEKGLEICFVPSIDTMVTGSVSDETDEYTCEKCHYKTAVKSNYTKHCMTAKHIRDTFVTRRHENVSEGNALYSCSNCNKQYGSRNGIWWHSKKCLPSTEKKADVVTEQNEPVTCSLTTAAPLIDAGMVVSLLKKNQELQELMVEQHKQLQEHMKQQQEEAKTHYELVNKLVERDASTTNNNTTNNNTINNNNNQKFNLNFFLNETCKDAMNLKDFIDNIYITFEELMLISDTGFVNGVTDIFIKRLRQLDVTKRPIHCTDIKRETIFIRDDNTWYKDDQDNTKLKAAIERIEYRNVVALNKWCSENPAAMINNTEENLLRDKIYLQTLLGDKKTREKIIRNLSKELAIDKKEFLKN